MTKELAPHQQRVVDEKTELDERREKLGQFKHTPVFERLPWQEQERLNTQAHIMTMYSAVLGERIAAF
ncbi:crAss001_48 related protein [Burkholderia stabilis]